VGDELELLAAAVPEGITARESRAVIQGLGRWLFDAEGAGTLTGDTRLTRYGLRAWQWAVELRASWVLAAGATYLLLIAPAKQSARPEYLPSHLHTSPVRPAIQLTDHLAAAGVNGVLYPLRELTEDERATFSEQDSYWNANGAFIAYRTIMEALPDSVPARMLERDDIGFAWRETKGDLGRRLGPRETQQSLLGRPYPRHSYLLHDSCAAGEGRTLITVCERAPEGRCVVFGDFSAYRLLPYMAESFREVVFAHTTSLDFDLVEQEKPSLVVSIVREQDLIDVPNDVLAPTVKELADRAFTAAPLERDLAVLWGQEAPGKPARG
jgi:hypothetical protein